MCVVDFANGRDPSAADGARGSGDEATRAAVILPWDRQGRDVAGVDQPRAAEARLAEAVGLAASIGLLVVHETILPLRERRPSMLLGAGQVSTLGELIAQNPVEVVIVD